MGLYSHYVFPRFMDWVMSGKEFQRSRTLLLHDAHGEILAIRLGTGLNLTQYAQGVSRPHCVDSALLLPERVARRSKSSSFPTVITRVSAETLPFDNRSFDCVVSTWTLCTIPGPVEALQ